MTAMSSFENQADIITSSRGSNPFGGAKCCRCGSLRLLIISSLDSNRAHDSQNKDHWLLCIYTVADVDNRPMLLDGEVPIVPCSSSFANFDCSVDARGRLRHQRM